MRKSNYSVRCRWMPAAWMLAACFVYAEDVTYTSERYELIIDRAPFGTDPLTEAGSSAGSAKAAAAVKGYRLCFLLESENGEVRAGFQNTKAKEKEPKSIILKEGESYLGMKLLSIDLLESQAVMDVNGDEVLFELTKAPTAARQVAAVPEPSSAPKRRFGGGFRRREPPQQAQPQPQLQPQPAPVEEPHLTEEEREQRRAEVREQLEEYQMEVIRQGMPPLPIPLTEEMDNQLVEEGVLPPME